MCCPFGAILYLLPENLTFTFMNWLVLNGPNLNLLGTREPEIYGTRNLSDLEKLLKTSFPGDFFEFIQSNHEGALVDAVQHARADGIVLNAAAYTHTSIALADALKVSSVPVVEVHLTNIYAREPYRHKSMIAPHVLGQISGFGFMSYVLAVQALKSHLAEK